MTAILISQEDGPYGIVTESYEIGPAEFNVILSDSVVATNNLMVIHFDHNEYVRSEKGNQLRTHVNPELEEPAGDLDLSQIRDRVVNSMPYKTRTILADVAKSMADVADFENVIDVDAKDLARFTNKISKESKGLSKRLREDLLPAVMSFDHASAYVEAFVRDGLELSGFAVDSGDLSPHIAALVKIQTVSHIAESMKGNKKLMAKYLNLFTQQAFDEAVLMGKNLAKRVLAERYTQTLSNPVGRVTNSIGTVSGLSKRHEEKAHNIQS